MRKKTNFLIYPLLIMGVFLVFASSCKKDDDKAGIPVLTTASISDITSTTAKSGGNITSDGGAAVTARGVCWSTSGTPTIADNKTTDGNGAGVFASSISGLTANTTYSVRAYATNSVGTGYGSSISVTTQGGSSGGTFTDSRDGNVYQTITIGTQVWMAEDLKYLPSVVSVAISSETTPYYYVYDYSGSNVADAKASANYSTYGVLYNWPAAMAGGASSSSNPSGVKGVCPTGWHLPSDAEFTQLSNFLGGDDVAGGKLKAIGTTYWSSPNVGATNSSGFRALPGGCRHIADMFVNKGVTGSWWSATVDYSLPSFINLSFGQSKLIRNTADKSYGFSVRCVKN